MALLSRRHVLGLGIGALGAMRLAACRRPKTAESSRTACRRSAI